MSSKERILVLAPHTDDGELGCGATIAKYKRSGYEVTYIAFSTCAQSIPSHLPSDILKNECDAATRTLGIDEVIYLDFQVRLFHNYRQDILEELVKIGKQFRPNKVFLPAREDIHQDHRIIHEEGVRAFKNCTLLGYELPWNNLRFNPVYFENIHREDLLKKIDALGKYQSQAHRKYMEPEAMTSLARVRGLQANTELAEAFEIYRMIQ
ncbi:MAG TPA: PIG-L deacetylase family protein [Flavisolibacter sp.]|jgi:LmbE family N-acetylglucosaminyl deacetylase|nr:PIG-L deacetylase family protein [Flavisolibacter sp.]